MKDLLQHFREKQLHSETESVFDTQCPFCSMQCKMQLMEQRTGEQKRYKVVPVHNPTSEGRVCIKGRNAHQHAVSGERITEPLLKVDGVFTPVSWERALQVIRERFTDIQGKDGRDALGVYGSGSLTNEEAYLLGKFARVALGTRYVDYNGRFCMSAAASAASQAFGMDRGLTHTLSDIPLAKCIILAGTNLVECQPTLPPYFNRAKSNGAYIIVIDPRTTPTAKLADLHLKIKPGTDAALVNGILKMIVEEGLVDPEFIAGRTNGHEELFAHLASIDLQQVAEGTGISIEQIRLAALAYGQAETGMVLTARGVEQQTDGYMTVRNFINLALVTGKIGRAGCGYGAITGQSNGQGGREHGLKADQLPGYRSIENEEHRSHVARVWGIEPEDLPRSGVSAYEMLEKVLEGEITGLFVMCSNPVISAPDADVVEAGLRKLKFLVVADLFMSETARLADVILPSSSYLEDEGTMTNLEGRVMLRQATRMPPGQAKHDWQIVCEIAGALGKGQFFSYKTPEAIFDELRLASKGGIADYFGITYERLRAGDGILWPCPSPGHDGETALFSQAFAHEDGRARLLPVENRFDKAPISKEFPLHITTGRIIAQYLTGVQTRRSQGLSARHGESFMEIHPLAAEACGIEDGALVRVESERGRVIVKSKVTTGIREDTIFIPMHWGEGQSVNKLMPPHLDPYCRMPGFKLGAVRIQPVVAPRKEEDGMKVQT